LSHWDNNYYVDDKIYALIRCQVCGLVEVEDKPQGADLARYYPRHYYAYDTSENLPFRMKAAAARSVVGLPRPIAERLLLEMLYAFPPDVADPATLDVGCGDGSALRFLKELGFKRLHGTEIEDGCRPILEQQGIEVTVTSDLAAAGLPEDAFDLVRMNHVLEHVGNPAETIAQARRLLKKGGKLLVAVPNFDSPARRVFGRYFCGLQLPTHLYHFNETNLARMLESGGFVVGKLFTTGFSGWSFSLLTLLRDKYRLVLPGLASTALILALAPAEAASNLFDLGYIITVEAVRT